MPHAVLAGVGRFAPELIRGETTELFDQTGMFRPSNAFVGLNYFSKIYNKLKYISQTDNICILIPGTVTFG